MDSLNSLFETKIQKGSAIALGVAFGLFLSFFSFHQIKKNRERYKLFDQDNLFYLLLSKISVYPLTKDDFRHSA